MKLRVLALVVILSGCANWTPEQHADFQRNMQIVIDQQRQQQQMAIQRNHELQLERIRSNGYNRPLNCYSYRVGNTTQTHCN